MAASPLIGCCQSWRAAPTFFQSIVNMIYIHSMNLNSLDLNLLVALDALLREASVSRAAMRIGLSQPAASHALQRLRDLLGDPLLVRTGARMELTPRAQALRGPLAQALDQVRGLFIPRRFRRRSQRAAFSADDARSRGRAADAAADGEGDEAGAERHHRRGAVAGARDLHRRVRPHHRSRDLDRRRLQGLSPPAPLYRQRRARGAARPSRGRKT